MVRIKLRKVHNFSVTIEKDLENGKKKTYRIKINHRVRFMASLLSSLAYNLAEGIYIAKIVNLILNI